MVIWTSLNDTIMRMLHLEMLAARPIPIEQSLEYPGMQIRAVYTRVSAAISQMRLPQFKPGKRSFRELLI